LLRPRTGALLSKQIYPLLTTGQTHLNFDDQHFVSTVEILARHPIAPEIKFQLPHLLLVQMGELLFLSMILVGGSFRLQADLASQNPWRFIPYSPGFLKSI